jgi:hypothetical protein
MRQYCKTSSHCLRFYLIFGPARIGQHYFGQTRIERPKQAYNKKWKARLEETLSGADLKKCILAGRRKGNAILW